MSDDLVTEFLPILGRSLERGFNVFDVMHHGTHEKQLSNIFAWLLDVGGSHNLDDGFLNIFVDEVNAASPSAPVPHERYRVRQEVNTGLGLDDVDIADLVLEGESAVIVVENYFTSDGHGHSYERYLEFGRRENRQAVGVLLCREENRACQAQSWEDAAVLTYGPLIARFAGAVDGDATYQRKNSEAYAFIQQLQRKFVREKGLVSEQDVIRFLTAMCDTGGVRRFGESPREKAAERFASDLAVQARERFDEGLEVLRRVKGLLRDYAAGPLSEQLNASLVGQRVQTVRAPYAGIYQWTIILDVMGEGDVIAATIQLKFGPSAWFANEQDAHWKRTIDPVLADYSCVFVTHVEAGVIRQSTVTLQDVLDGLEPTDTRLHDEAIRLLGSEPAASGGLGEAGSSAADGL